MVQWAIMLQMRLNMKHKQLQISIQLHNLLKYIYVCNKTQPLTSKPVADTIGEAIRYKDNNEPTCDMIKSKKTVMINQKHLVIQMNIYKRHQTSQQSK